MTTTSWRRWGLPGYRRLLSVLLALGVLASACSSSASTNEGATGGDETTEAGEATESEATESEETTESANASPIEPASFDVEFESDRCEFLVEDGFDAECGWVDVPQNWDDASDPDTVRLHVATITNDQTPDSTPVVYLEGGPGGDLFGGLEFGLGDRWGQLIDEHPLVVFSQRGSAISEVDLECEEVVDHSLEILEQDPDFDSEVNSQLEAFEACAERLIGEGADLTAYNTVSSANDAEAVRLALDLDEWNVLGISYGTRLGQEILRTHPDGVAAIVLDSVQPVDTSLGSLAAVPTTFEGALERFFEGCSSDAACADQFPDLEDRLFAIIDQAASDPFEVEAIDQLSLDSYDAIVDDSRLAGVIFNALYAPVAFGALPPLVEELENGETTILETLVGVQVTNTQFVSNGHFQAVMCHDYNPEAIPEGAFQAQLTGNEFFDETFIPSSTAAEVWADTCAAFPSGQAPAADNEPVESDVPALLLSGEYDPITPPSFADAVEPGLTNSQNIVHPNQGHAVTSDECGLDLALAFFAAPGAEVDTACLESSQPPPFVAPSLEGTVLEPFQESQLGILGVRPEGWSDQGFGASVRDDASIADQLVLLQQAAPAGEAQLVNLFATQFDFELIEAGGLTAGGRSWTMYEGESLLVGNVRLWTREDAGFTLAAALIGPEAGIADAQEHLIEEILANLRLG